MFQALLKIFHMQEDIPGFERYMAQLQTYYHDHQVQCCTTQIITRTVLKRNQTNIMSLTLLQGHLPDSPFQYQLLGLNLLCLLSQVLNSLYLSTTCSHTHIV